MRLKSIVRFSWKNLWAHRLRTALTVGGVTIGVSAIVFLVSLGFGLEQLVSSQVANFEAFTIIEVPSAAPPTGKINQEAVDKISDIGHIKEIERIVDLAGRVRLGSQNSTTETVVTGVQPPYFDLADLTLAGGQLFSKGETDKVVINTALASLLGYSANPTDALKQTVSLDLIVPKTLRAPDLTDGPAVKEKLSVQVVGLTPDNQGPIMYVSQALTDGQGVVNSTSMKIKVDDRAAVPVVRKQMENMGFVTEYVGDTVDQISQVFSVFRIVLGGFGTIALIVAALGTFNTLTISLMERIREVSLLKMLGMKRKDVFKLFINESLTIGILGGLSGTLFGLAVGYGLNRLVTHFALKAGADPVSIFYTPMNFIMFVGISSIAVGFLTGLYPSLRAIKTNPLDALRYE